MIFGHKKKLKIFSDLIKSHHFPHAVLFAGPSKLGKKTIALEITKYLLQPSKFKKAFFQFTQEPCRSQICDLIDEGKVPGVFRIEEDNDFSIKQIRELRAKLSLSSPYRFKTVILDNVENLSREATSALLKTLEEPTGRTIFFLITAFPYTLPKTIVSRCETFKFYPLSRKEIRHFISQEIKEKNVNISGEEIDMILDFSVGRPGMAENMLIDRNRLLYYNSILRDLRKIQGASPFEKMIMAEKLNKEEKTNDFLFMAGYWFRDLLMIKNGNSQLFLESLHRKTKDESKKFSEKELREIIQEIYKKKKNLLFSNVSRLLALENLLLRI